MALEVDLSSGILEIRFSGSVGADDFVRLGQEVVAWESRLPTSPDRITDFTATTALDADFAAIERIAQVRNDHPPKNQVRSAVVAPRPVQYGVARMFQSMNTCASVEMRVFPDRASAVRWLGTPRS